MSTESTHSTARASRAVATLQGLQHLLFAVIYLVGLVLAVIRLGSEPGWVLPVTGALLAWYAVGIVIARRRTDGWHGPVWALVLVATWLPLSWCSPGFRYLVLPLFLLALHVLGRGLGAVTIVALTAWLCYVGISQHPGDPWPQVIGPVMAALLAVGAAAGYSAVLRESRERGRLLAEVEQLSDELARTQRESGTLAERQRLARDIHDTLAQGFSSIILLARAGLADPGRAPELLAQVEATASDNLAEARRVVHALAPEDLTAEGLPAALGRILARVGANGLETRLSVEGEPHPVPTAVEVALLRVAQGALANVTSHARARTVALTLSYDDQVSLDVVDDGIGFDPERLAPAGDGSGFGLRALRDRIAELGGSLTVESAPGDGTAVAARVPTGVRTS